MHGFLDNIKNLAIKITTKLVKVLTNIKQKLNVINTIMFSNCTAINLCSQM